jgi:hypothetical protein
VRNLPEGDDDVRLVEVGGTTGPCRNRSTELQTRSNAGATALISAPRPNVRLRASHASAIFPRLTGSPELTEPPRTAVGPTTERRLYPGVAVDAGPLSTRGRGVRREEL